jgi:hypothetical protein
MRELRRAARGGGLVEARGAWGETGAVVVVVGGGGAYRYAPGREGGWWGGRRGARRAQSRIGHGYTLFMKPPAHMCLHRPINIQLSL